MQFGVFIIIYLPIIGIITENTTSPTFYNINRFLNVIYYYRK